MSFWGHPHRRFPPVSGFTLITRVSISASSVTTPSHQELEIIIHSLKGFVTQTVYTKKYNIFSIHDELIGHAGVLVNQAACYRAGYQIMIDAEGGHRLRREVIRQIKREIFEKK